MAVPSLLVLGVSLDLNQACAEELALVPGVRRQVAERIVAHRLQRGAFLRLEDLEEVTGIGPVTVERLRPYLTVNGGAEGAKLTAHGSQEKPPAPCP
jgi:competence ComEA-like helix-hairpin-helix protein